MADNERLRELIDLWEEAHERGEEPSIDELCADFPELADPLRDWVSALKSMEWLENSTDGGSDQDEATANEGRQVGRYRLERMIGQGGFGEVWAACDPDLDRQVAIKLPRNDQATLQDVDAFLVEARKLANLRHPGIIPVFDVGQAEGHWFFVCELIEGANLSQRVADGPFPPEEAARIVRDIALALHHAHEHGFIHRDIKPSNILIDRTGKAYLTDFGIALATSALGGVRAETVGTLAYMAPEQIEGTGGVASVRTDIYGLGVVLYQMLTGDRPFREESPIELRTAILSGSPTPLSLNTPAALRYISLRALARDPAERYSSAKEVADALDRFLVPKRRWPIRIGLGLALLLLIVGGFTWNWWRGKQEEAEASSKAALAEVEKAADEAVAYIDQSMTLELHGPTEEGPEPDRRNEARRHEPLVISRFTSSVDLSGRDLSDPDFQQLARAPFVRRLNLADTSTTDEHVKRLATMPMLEDLDLSGTQVSDDGLRHLEMVPALLHLSLAKTAVTDEGLTMLGPMHIRTLNLSGTKITDAGLIHLGNLYGVAGQLTALNLSNTAITDHAIEPIKKLSRLESLDLRQTKVTDSGVRAIQTALPDCAIEK